MRLTLPGTTVLATSIVLICLCHSVVLAQEGPGLSETPQTRAAVEENTGDTNNSSTIAPSNETSGSSQMSSEATTILPTTLTPNTTGNDTSSTNETLTESPPIELTTPIPSIETDAHALQVVGNNETEEAEANDFSLKVNGTINGTRLEEEDDDWSLNGTEFGSGNFSTEDEGHLVEHILSVGDGSNEILDNSNASNDSASSTPVNDNLIQEPPPSIDYQTQIYIVSGTLGGILLLLIILVLALALSVAKLKDQLEKRQKSYLVDDNNINHNPDAAGLGRDQIHAYDNSAFTGVGDATEMQERSVDAKMEIARRGYTVYNGNSHENSYADPADLRFEHENRLEMKVPAKNPAESSHDECDEASDPHADLSSREQRWLSRAQAAHNMSTRRNKHSSLLCCMALKSLDRRITP
ncbi:uncharacterized protein LOC131880250 isoform X2 [Tigriopus californicus]|nr:uncharacterized protein LOC131880250 isoform X2 [Tigriopus californicus]XP_059082813.1 uncharacterized protein LOC131880250 isoform X2 [Tigriopus californicus]XP_059082814.1 uncharacterized protein LOC131880250 isoform X2 [Tigriopus californicus]